MTEEQKSDYGPSLLTLWEKILPMVKDLKIRFALAMIGNVLALWFLVTYFKNLIPNIPPELM